jgi:23S rRNA U2552 (ribose-2'-O)-methylase RlmE/FtsJ
MLAVENPLIRATIRKTEDAIIITKSKVCLELDKQKEKVPEYKKRAGDKRWALLVEASFTKETKPICSKAYYKLREIIQTCALPSPKTSFHICEAPGGFVQAMLDEYDSIEKWYATSYEDGIKFKTELLNMKIGEILKPEKKGNILDKSVRESFKISVDFVTADGSFLEEDHNSIEESNYDLFAAQADVAMRCLNKKGTFVCKFFEGMEAKTQVLVAVLTNCFVNVSIIKPVSSKETNSERYLVCRGFETYIDVIDTKWCTSEPWLEDLQEVFDEYGFKQAKKLEEIFKKV